MTAVEFNFVGRHARRPSHNTSNLAIDAAYRECMVSSTLGEQRESSRSEMQLHWVYWYWESHKRNRLRRGYVEGRSGHHRSL